ncbi:glycosyltransferase [Cavenderia fasciculata]|uniref:Fucosyltransferase n=1 Tax=Cavenderia fasciculata TaxID=261658 RepID=F4PSV1_CACFS|nr:glycosyltransferase [Cavenderia fasciculata]EGG21579.1 glycosyltransferase [Cavenderia fasciculata]|eukprot:XP_004359429.1 glycosyltransferase [Cavenderia fasciculata]
MKRYTKRIRDNKLVFGIIGLILLTLILLIYDYNNTPDYYKLRLLDKQIDETIERNQTLFLVGNEYGKTAKSIVKTYDCGMWGTTKWKEDSRGGDNISPNGIVMFGSELSNMENPIIPRRIDSNKVLSVYIQLHSYSSDYARCDKHQDCMGLFQWSIGYKKSDTVQVLPYQGRKLLENIYNQATAFNYTTHLKMFKSINHQVCWISSSSSCGDDDDDDDRSSQPLSSSSSDSRTQFVKQLMEYIKVDSYGSCLNNVQMPKGGGKDEYNSHSIKLQVMSRYQFYLAFEKINCQEYLSEVVYHCLSAGVVPVIIASPDTHSRLPKGSYIDAEQFDSAIDLANHLKSVYQNQTLYQQYFNWRNDVYALRNWIDNAFPSTTYSRVACEIHRRYLETFRHRSINHPPEPFLQIKPSHCYDPYLKYLN